MKRVPRNIVAEKVPCSSFTSLNLFQHIKYLCAFHRFCLSVILSNICFWNKIVSTSWACLFGFMDLSNIFLVFTHIVCLVSALIRMLFKNNAQRQLAPKVTWTVVFLSTVCAGTEWETAAAKSLAQPSLWFVEDKWDGVWKHSAGFKGEAGHSCAEKVIWKTLGLVGFSFSHFF